MDKFLKAVMDWLGMDVSILKALLPLSPVLSVIAIIVTCTVCTGYLVRLLVQNDLQSICVAKVITITAKTDKPKRTSRALTGSAQRQVKRKDDAA